MFLEALALAPIQMQELNLQRLALFLLLKKNNPPQTSADPVITEQGVPPIAVVSRNLKVARPIPNYLQRMFIGRNKGIGLAA